MAGIATRAAMAFSRAAVSVATASSSGGSARAMEDGISTPVRLPTCPSPSRYSFYRSGRAASSARTSTVRSAVPSAARAWAAAMPARGGLCSGAARSGFRVSPWSKDAVRLRGGRDMDRRPWRRANGGRHINISRSSSGESGAQRWAFCPLATTEEVGDDESNDHGGGGGGIVGRDWTVASIRTEATSVHVGSPPSVSKLGSPDVTSKSNRQHGDRSSSVPGRAAGSRSPSAWQGSLTNLKGISEAWERVSGSMKRCALTAAVAAVLFCGQPAELARAESVTVTFPASRIEEVLNVQKTLIETWGIIRETYVDGTFNNQDWDGHLENSLAEMLKSTSADAAYNEIRYMIASLGDPFTRIITKQEYDNFRINNDGALQGVGLLIASEPETGRLIVLTPIDGSPAARAGIHAGDELIQIDNQTLEGLNGEEAAMKLRGQAGTRVRLKLRTAGGRMNPYGPKLREVIITRATIALSPVFSAVLPHSTKSGKSTRMGYIRLTNFSQNAGKDMAKAISHLEKEGADSYILDLRNNPGGLVKSGFEVAQMWLDGNDVLVNTIDRAGHTQPIKLVNSHALTDDPLVLLVNEGSASASEILASALQDNGRAYLMGQKTYGKGKIQSVFELEDGSALFVTVAKYLSPALHQIDQVGVFPDRECSVNTASSELPVPLDIDASEDVLASQIEQDACIAAAAKLILENHL